MSKKTSAALLSVASNSVLITMKVIVGLMSGSVSIISEAIHSSMDLVASFIALFSVKTSDQPADDDHPYGHGKIENVSGVIEAVLILVAAVWIIYESIRKIIYPQAIESLGIGFVVMLVSAGINVLVSRYLFKVARQEHSVALAADALHLKADVITSLGVGIGLCLIWVFSLFKLELFFLDPIVAILVAVFITKEAIEMLVHAFNPLMDHSIPGDEQQIVAEVINRHRPEGTAHHSLRTRQAGKWRHIDFHMTLPKNMTVAESHAICDKIEREIEEQLPFTMVLIHVEPEETAPPLPPN